MGLQLGQVRFGFGLSRMAMAQLKWVTCPHPTINGMSLGMVLSHSGQVLVIDLSSSLSLVQVQILSVQHMLPRLLPIYILFVFYILF